MANSRVRVARLSKAKYVIFLYLKLHWSSNIEALLSLPWLIYVRPLAVEWVLVVLSLTLQVVNVQCLSESA